MPTLGKGVESGAVRSLLDLFRFGKKKKEKGKKEPVRASEVPAIAEPLPKHRPEPPPAATPPQDVPAVVTPTQPEPAPKVAEAAPCAPAPPKSDVQLESQPVDGTQVAVQHDKLLAALESTQNTADPLVNSARMSFNVADLSGVLFVHRTNTQSGTGMVLPSRVAEGGHVASGLNSEEATPLQRIHEDTSPGPYVPQCNSTATGAVLHSAAINTAATYQDSSNALYSMANNLQDMLYADYDTLERIQTRPEAGSVGGAAGVASGGVRRDARPPAMPSLLRPPQVAAQEAQMELEALQKGMAEPHGDGGAAGSSTAATPPPRPQPIVNAKAPEALLGAGIGPGGEPGAGSTATGGTAHSIFRSAPLVQVQLKSPQEAPGPAAGGLFPAADGRAQHGNQTATAATAAGAAGAAAPAAAALGLGSSPDRKLDGGDSHPQHSQGALQQQQQQQQPNQQQLQQVQGSVAAEAQQSRPCPPVPSAVQSEGPGGAAAAAATAGSVLQPGSLGPTPAAPAKSGTGAGAIRSGGAASDTQKSLSQEINLRRVPAPKPNAAPAAAPAAPPPAAVPAANRAETGRPPGGPAGYLTHDLASLVAGPALPSYSQKPNPQAEPPAQLSRPMKLTTACLSAYTTLYDNGGDQNFQRALQRKMQLVYKWLQASDLTAPPDNRLEVPLDAEGNEVGPGLGAAGGGGGEGALHGDGAHHSGREGAAALPAAAAGGQAGTGTPAGMATETRGPHRPEHAASTSAPLAAPAAAAASPHALGAGSGQVQGRPGTSGDGQAASGPAAAASGPGPAPAAAQAHAHAAPAAGLAHPTGDAPGHGGTPASETPWRRDAGVAHGAGAVAAATPAGGPGVPNDRGLLAQNRSHQPQLQPQRQQQQHVSAQLDQHSGAPGYLNRSTEHPGAGAVAEAEAESRQPLPHAAGTGRPAPALSADPTVAAATAAAVGQQQQLLLQHSLSDLYGNSQALPGVHLPPRVLAGSEADLASASANMAAAAEVQASAAAPPPPAAAAAAERPSASRLHGRATSSAPMPGPDGALQLHSAAAADAAMSIGAPSHPPPQQQQELQQHHHPHGPAPARGTPSAPSSTSGAATPAGAGRTKSIAVASHCPPELQPQPASAPWTIDDFSLLKKLYEGSLSVVCQAQHKRSGRHVALKIYKRSRLHEMERFQLAREICLHIRIVHPHVVALYAAWKDSKYVYLALDWAPLGNMFDFLVARGGRLGEEEAARVVMMPLMSALAFLHSQHFIHRDVKLENLLLDASNCLKLADFGLAIDQKFEQANTRLGTFGYFAPEVLDCPLKKGPFDMKDTSVPGYDSRVDVWSAGVVGYEVLTGRAPFSASSPSKIIQAIRTRVLDFPGISEEGRDFLRSALTRDPASRPTAKQLLSHPWILRHCGGGPSVLPSPPLHSPTPAPVSAPEALPLAPSPMPPMQLVSASATVASGPTERVAPAEMAPQVVTLIADGALSAPSTLAELGGGRLAGRGEGDVMAPEGLGRPHGPGVLPQTRLPQTQLEPRGGARAPQ